MVAQTLIHHTEACTPCSLFHAFKAISFVQDILVSQRDHILISHASQPCAFEVYNLAREVDGDDSVIDR